MSRENWDWARTHTKNLGIREHTRVGTTASVGKETIAQVLYF